MVGQACQQGRDVSITLNFPNQVGHAMRVGKRVAKLLDRVKFFDTIDCELACSKFSVCATCATCMVESL